MRLWRGMPILLMLAAACVTDPQAPIVPPPAIPIDLPSGFVVDVFTAGLDLPTSIAFAPDGSNRLFINELQSGKVRIVENGTLLEPPFARFETSTSGSFPVMGENGLLGLAFDPQYPVNRYVYFSYAYRTDSTTLGRVVRLTDAGNRGTDPTVLLDSLPSAQGHQIESLIFGPDGKLYVSTGDAFRAQDVQVAASRVGKVLRLNPDGTIPADNPIPGVATYALGFRNAFDLGFDDAGRLYATDNGPDRDDELNLVVAGGNYGWPLVMGSSAVPDYETPLKVWSQVVAPAGMTFYHGTQFPAQYRGKLFLALFGDTYSMGFSSRAKRIQVVDLGETPPRFTDFAVYQFPGLGNPLDLAVGPDGSLFLSDIFQGRVLRFRYRP